MSESVILADGGTQTASNAATRLGIAAFAAGLGFGGIDFGLNYFFSIGFGKRSASMSNLLNAHFGVGAILGPAAVGWLGAAQYHGLSIAPISPTGLAWLGALVPASRGAAALIIAMSMVGGIVFPPLVGLVIQGAGVATAPLFLAVLSCVCTDLIFSICCHQIRSERSNTS